MARRRRPRGPHRPADDPVAAGRASGPARRGGARRDRTRRRRGKGLPYRRGDVARARRTADAGPPAPARARAEGIDPPRPRRVRRRRRVPVPTPADPRRGLPGDAEGTAGRAARGLRPVAAGGHRRPRGRLPGDPRTPSGTGLSVSQRARPGGRSHPGAGARCRASAASLGGAGDNRGDVDGVRAPPRADDRAGDRSGAGRGDRRSRREPRDERSLSPFSRGARGVPRFTGSGRPRPPFGSARASSVWRRIADESRARPHRRERASDLVASRSGGHRGSRRAHRDADRVWLVRVLARQLRRVTRGLGTPRPAGAPDDPDLPRAASAWGSWSIPTSAPRRWSMDSDTSRACARSRATACSARFGATSWRRACTRWPATSTRSTPPSRAPIAGGTRCGTPRAVSSRVRGRRRACGGSVARPRRSR